MHPLKTEAHIFLLLALKPVFASVFKESGPLSLRKKHQDCMRIRDI
jgi:hypothetical protein